MDNNSELLKILKKIVNKSSPIIEDKREMGYQVNYSDFQLLKRILKKLES